MSVTLLATSVAILILLYFYLTRKHDYWKKRNVKYVPPIPLFGNHFRTVFGISSITTVTSEYYKRYPDEKVVGYYRGCTPELIIRDLDIARDILSVHFSHFYKRGLGRNKKVEPMIANLFNDDDITWKVLRQLLTPAFTTAKLKKMFPLIVTCALKLETLGNNIVSQGGECDVRELMAKFTTEFIGACGFGIQMNTINENRSFFRDLGQKIFNVGFRNMFVLALWELLPEIGYYFGVKSREVENALLELVQKIREQRQFKPIGRNDFIDLLLEIEAKGKIIGESAQKNPDGTSSPLEMELDLNCFAAQVFVFFAAGFETSSSATSFTLHKLAYHPEIQHKIQKEIDNVLLKYDNKLCYDAILEMDLLEMAFKESMRLFPSLGTLHRQCSIRYTVPGLGITIDPGVKISIPIQAIHQDEKYFENPKKFIPERFAKDNINQHNLHKYAYLPFGEGPRSCIGARLGQMQSLAGLAALLSKFTVEPSASSQPELRVNQRSNVVQSILGGVPLKLRLR